MSKNAKYVVGISVVILLGIAAFALWTKLGATTTDITLADSGGNCVPTKEPTVHVSKGNNVKWHVENNCGSAQTVLVGNFHRSTGTNRPNCGQDASDFPFNDGDINNRSVTVNAGASGQIVLNGAKNETSSAITYDYDVCVGGTKRDPQLVIDP